MVNNQKKWSDTERAAYHEAGHVVAAYLQRIRFVYCSVDQKDFVEKDADGLVRIARSVVSSLANIDMTYNPPPDQKSNVTFKFVLLVLLAKVFCQENITKMAAKTISTKPPILPDI